MPPYLSIIIPAYNEAKRLPDTLTLLQHFFAEQPYSIEVLVVDDGSTDATVEVVEKAAQHFPELKVISNSVNKGKGGVVKQGMLVARGEYRLFLDADNSTPIEELPKLLKEVPTYSIVIGSRYLKPGSIKVRQPWRRRVISRLSNWLIQRLLLPGISDTQCGFKLFSAEAAERVFPQQIMSGWSFDFELLTIAHQLGYSIKEVPVDWFDSRHSTLRASRAAFKALKDLIVIYQRVHQHKYR